MTAPSRWAVAIVGHHIGYGVAVHPAASHDNVDGAAHGAARHFGLELIPAVRDVHVGGKHVAKLDSAVDVKEAKVAARDRHREPARVGARVRLNRADIRRGQRVPPALKGR